MVEQIWLVTGCSSGFGEQFIKSIVRQGDLAIATARSLDSIRHLADLGAATLQLDVTSSQDVLDERMKTAHSIYGSVDVLVQNAGYGTIGMLEDLGNDRLEKQFATNVFGMANLTRAIMPYWREQQSGTLLLISSSASSMCSPGLGGYCASKAAAEGLIRAFKKETEGWGLKTLILQPGTYRTDMRNPSKIDMPAFSKHNESMMNRYKCFMSSTHGKQTGDPAKFVDLAIELVKGEGRAYGKEVPISLPIGPDAITSVRTRLNEDLKALERWEDIVKATDFDQGMDEQVGSKNLAYLSGEDSR